jgi:hypothetical protein
VCSLGLDRVIHKAVCASDTAIGRFLIDYHILVVIEIKKFEKLELGRDADRCSARRWLGCFHICESPRQLGMYNVQAPIE